MAVSRLKIDLAFGAALVLLGLAALLAFRSVQKLRSSASSVVQTERVLREITALSGQVMEAETSQRGYLLTQQESFRQRYRTARSSLQNALLTLQSLVADNPAQIDRIQLLTVLVEQRLVRMEDAMQLGERGDFAAAAELVRAGEGQQLTDSIAAVSRAMAADEFLRLEQRRTSESATAGGTILFVLMGGAAAILIVATSRQSLLAQLSRREEAERALEVNQKYLHELYTVAASQALTYPQRLQAIVALGADRFNVPLGVLARERNGTYQILAVHDPEGSLRPGTTLSAGDPCLAPIVAPEGTIDHIPEGSPCFGGRPIRSSLRMDFRVVQGGAGWLAFLDTAERAEGYADGDRVFLGVLAQWASVEMERYAVRRELEEREERYRVVVENANDLIFITDAEGRFTYVNPIASATVGYSPEKLVRMRSIDLVREDLRDEMRRRLREQVRLRTPSVYYELPVITRDGREVWLGQNLQLLTAGDEVIGLQAVARDITRQLEMERMKDEFLSVVSHELRTPLTSIRGSLGLLVSGRMGSLEPQGQRMLEIAAHNTDRLVRLINDLLDIDKIESGKAPLNVAPSEISTLVEGAAEVMQPLAARNGVRLEVQTVRSELPVDPDRIVQLMTNLISNAIKFSEDGGVVRVTMERTDDELKIAVSDHGRGIPRDKLDLIFERFQQVDSTDSRRRGGTGLGLAIVRRIAEQHGGTVVVESEWGEGSTFTFTLPAARAARDETHHTAAPTAVGVEERCDVLIVEDDGDLARVICETLESRGYSTRHAQDGEEALEVSERLTYGLLLLDPGLPGLNGFALVEHLRRDPRHNEVPVLVYTTRTLTGPEREALRIGPTEILTKTRHPLEALEARVADLLGPREAEALGE